MNILGKLSVAITLCVDKFKTASYRRFFYSGSRIAQVASGMVGCLVVFYK
jgi:hypothetical protein